MAIDAGTKTGHDQRSDPPGSGARLMLLADLTVALRPDSPASVFAIFDLGGFSDYADAYGRLAGRDLLARIKDGLLETFEQPATFYGPREAEFAAIIRHPAAYPDRMLAAAVSTLTDQLAQFNLTLAYGSALLPGEASEPIEALKIADERLFLNARARKRRERRSVERERRAVWVAEPHLDR
jgi:two-component system cell cycle response regulator